MLKFSEIIFFKILREKLKEKNLNLQEYFTLWKNIYIIIIIFDI